MEFNPESIKALVERLKLRSNYTLKDVSVTVEGYTLVIGGDDCTHVGLNIPETYRLMKTNFDDVCRRSYFEEHGALDDDIAWGAVLDTLTWWEGAKDD